MLRLYNIIDVATLKRGVAKLQKYLDEEKQKQSKVRSLSKSHQSLAINE